MTLTGAGWDWKDAARRCRSAAELVDELPGRCVLRPARAARAIPSSCDRRSARAVGVRASSRSCGDREALAPARQLRACARCCRRRSRRCLPRDPPLKVLATSRAPLRLEGECEYAVDPLPDGRRGRALRRSGRGRCAGLRAGRLRGRDLPPARRPAARARARCGASCGRSTPRQLLERLEHRLAAADRRRAAMRRSGSRRCARRSSGATTCFLTSCSESFARLGRLCRHLLAGRRGSWSFDADVDTLAAIAEASLDQAAGRIALLDARDDQRNSPPGTSRKRTRRMSSVRATRSTTATWR